MSTPPKEKDQILESSWCSVVDGLRIPRAISVEAFKSALAYKPRADDLFIVTFPKCGTSWVQCIVSCLFREGKPIRSGMEFLLESPHLLVSGVEGAEKMKRPGAMKLHLPFHLTPWSPEAKYIFVARNPKDCCVSCYHYAENIPGYFFKGGEFDVFFECFMNGQTIYGDYFDTTLSWWEHRNDPNVLFITYEDLKKDIVNSILKIAGFIGPEWKEKLEQDEKLFHDVIRHSSFNCMKEHFNRHMDELAKTPTELMRNNPDLPVSLKNVINFVKTKLDTHRKGLSLVRKGIIGDWRNLLSPIQNARLEKKFEEKFAGTGLLDLWKDDMW